MNNNDETNKKPSHNAVQERARILADFRATFTGESGRSVLAVLKQSAGWGKPSFLPSANGGAIDPYAAAFRDGRKSIIDEIEANLAVAEDATPSEPKSIR